MKPFSLFILLLLFADAVSGQSGVIKGTLTSDNEVLEYAKVYLEETALGTFSNDQGKFEIREVPLGEYKLKVSLAGFEPKETQVDLNYEGQEIVLNLGLSSVAYELDQVVLTGTRTSKRQTESAVIVNVIDTRTLENVQACNLSEGLKFQPGLRVETDCQTCNYTQLRMNGLGGSYSQILINGRPIFSPLTGLYGMEQLPTNMIERIEVVRGGGSALYGSSAIGGTVNVITKIPKKNSYDVGYTFQNINGAANDHILAGNATYVNKQASAGGTIFINKRNRALYDHNGDNFSELPLLRNNSFGANFFFLPKENHKLEVSLSNLREYRYGGEMVDGPAHLALQSEERNHNVLVGNIDYQVNFNDENSSFIAYAAAQNTGRTHYTGIFPDESEDVQIHLDHPPYGTSANTTLQGGIQLNHRIRNFLGGSNVITVGSEYIMDDVIDQIDAYNYEIDQLTENFGSFVQSDWEVTPALNLLTGVRADKHNLVDNLILSPRVSLLYKLRKNTQFRMTWGTGFRAPQAFDTDLHLAFAGGGISRISLSPDLVQERSNSFSTSVNYDKAKEKFIAGFTLEGFYTHLNNAFYLHPLGEDAFGERFEKRNGAGAAVQGLTLELRANYDQKVQLEAGFTLQSSLFDEPVENIEGLEPRREFLRTPNQYGYAILRITPTSQWNSAINFVYTGPMDLVHFAGAPEQTFDTYTVSPSFAEVGIKTGYTVNFDRLNSGVEFYGGVKNLFNAYQNDFDSGKNRDSNYVFGPGAPRTFFLGLRIKG